MDQQRRRILVADISHRAEWVKRRRLLVGIMSGYFLGPAAVLPAIKVELAPLMLGRRLGNYGAADGLVSIFLRHERLGAVEGIRFAVPIAGDVAIPPESNQSPRP